MINDYAMGATINSARGVCVWYVYLVLWERLLPLGKCEFVKILEITQEIE